MAANFLERLPSRDLSEKEKLEGASILRSDTTQIRECCEKMLPSLRCLEILAGSICAVGTPDLSNNLCIDGSCSDPHGLSSTLHAGYPICPAEGNWPKANNASVSRWLHNARINVHRLYKLLIKAALSTWQENCLYFNLDTSLFGDQYCLMRLVVVYRGRALPLVWRVLA